MPTHQIDDVLLLLVAHLSLGWAVTLWLHEVKTLRELVEGFCENVPEADDMRTVAPRLFAGVIALYVVMSVVLWPLGIVVHRAPWFRKG